MAHQFHTGPDKRPFVDNHVAVIAVGEVDWNFSPLVLSFCGPVIANSSTSSFSSSGHNTTCN